MMNKAAPWSIKGVDFDAREAAREAAQREGMTLGEWLNDVIAQRAAERGESPDDFDEVDRMDAVSTRLARMRDDGELGRRRERRHDRYARHDNDDREGRDDVSDRSRARSPARPRPANLSRNARQREVSWREQGDAEALLENAIDAFERRASRSQEKTARALAEMADLLESSHSRSSRDDQTLKSIARRLGEIEERVGRRSDEKSFQPIRGALSRLESRLDALSGARDDAGLRDIDSKLSEIAEHLQRGAGERPRAEEPDRLARIEEQLAALSQQMDKAAERPRIRALAMEGPVAPRRPPVDAVSQIVQRQRELDGEGPYPFAARRNEPRPPFDLRRPPNEAETRLASILERLEQRLSPEAQAEQAAPQTVLLSGLQGDIARMAGHIERMREDMARQPALEVVAPPFPTEPLDQLRREISAVSRGLGDLAPRASVSALEHAVRDISDRLDVARKDPAAGMVEQLARELRTSLREIDPRGAIAALEQDMRAIAGKIENLETRDGVDPQTVRAIFDQTREVRELLSRASQASQNGERAQRELAQLAEKLEARPDSPGVAPAEFARIVSDIRAVVTEGLGASGLTALEKRVESLSQRIDAALAGAPGAQQFADFGERLDKLHRAVAQNLATPRSSAAVDTRHIEQLVRDLAEKVDRAAEPGASRDDLTALHTQIELLSRKIERSNGRDEAVAGLERMISDLFGQLNETRSAAFQAAETAARTAARETLREALENVPAVAGKNELSREIADLRSIQHESDGRTHATLKAVHETLEQVVDRLATLESDVVEARAPQSRREPEPPRAAAPTMVAQPAPRSVPAEPARALEPARAPEPAPASDRQRRLDMAPSLDDDILIEPGAGRARRAGASGGAGEPRSAQAGFIAAARRAALAAQAASAAAEEADAVEAAQAGVLAGPMGQARSLYERRRKPILLSLAALIGLLGVIQIATLYTRSSGTADRPAAITRPAEPAPVKSAPPADPSATVGAPAKPTGNDADGKDAATPPGPRAEAPHDGQSAAALETPAAAEKAPPAQLPPSSPQASALPSMARQPGTEIGKIDPAPVGAIAPAPVDVVALPLLEKAAAHGDPAAQYALAARFADGDNAPRDLKRAAHLFEKSAAKGLAPAQYRLGVLYERGLGVERDTGQAKTWYARAAERGNIRAMHNLAVLLADGGGKPDYPAAAKWFRRAAEHGVRDSQYNLAILYARGMGGPQDLVQSYLWFSAAAAQGDEDAGHKRDEVASRLDATALARAKALAASFRPAAVNPAANNVTPPAGGWAAPEPAAADGKSKARAKVTRL